LLRQTDSRFLPFDAANQIQVQQEKWMNKPQSEFINRLSLGWIGRRSHASQCAGQKHKLGRGLESV
jgi:hypothetical protein